MKKFDLSDWMLVGMGILAALSVGLMIADFFQRRKFYNSPCHYQFAPEPYPDFGPAPVEAGPIDPKREH